MRGNPPFSPRASFDVVVGDSGVGGDFLHTGGSQPFRVVFAEEEGPTRAPCLCSLPALGDLCTSSPPVPSPLPPTFPPSLKQCP
ncbi:MAG: hypothetical protein ACK559_02290, partial [bacterium]